MENLTVSQNIEKIYIRRLKDNEIRLATVLPGEFGDEIRCNLQTVDIESKGRYEALSYVWGDPNETRTIRLQGELFPVTTNLFMAMKRIRKRNKRWVIWIDAICINQTDLEERRSQMNLMRRIYEETSATIVFLGENIDGSLSAFTTLKKLSQKSSHKLYDLVFTNPKILAIFAVYNCEWWFRLWTYQEARSPPRLKFVSGAHELDGDEFFSFLALVEREPYKSRFCSALGVKHGEGGRKIQQVVDMRHARVLRRKDVRDRFLNVILANWKRKCSNPLDKVYTYYAFRNTDGDLSMVADYSKNPQDVYAEAVVREIQATGSLQILLLPHEIRRFHGAGRELRFSSWTPDFSADVDDAVDLRNGVMNFPTSPEVLSQKHWDRLTCNYLGRGRLSIFGREICTVKTVGPMEPQNSILQNYCNAVRRYVLKCQEIAGIRTETEYALDISEAEGRKPKSFHWSLPTHYTRRLERWQREWRDEFLRIMFGERFAGPNAEKLLLATFYARDWSAFHCPHITDSVFTMVPCPCLHKSELRERSLRFFASELLMGMGPTDVQLGDRVVIFPGNETPLVLRSAGFSPDWQPQYTLVGPAYASGIREYLQKHYSGLGLTEYILV